MFAFLTKLPQQSQKLNTSLLTSAVPCRTVTLEYILIYPPDSPTCTQLSYLPSRVPVHPTVVLNIFKPCTSVKPLILVLSAVLFLSADLLVKSVG